jgi:hypothetical protein
MRQPEFLNQLWAAASSEGARSLRAQKAADVIRRRRAYRWVGIYEVEREDLSLVAWSGFGDHPDALPAPPEGLHGRALRTGTAEVAKSRSKIVVPIGGRGAAGTGRSWRAAHPCWPPCGPTEGRRQALSAWARERLSLDPGDSARAAALIIHRQ